MANGKHGEKKLIPPNIYLQIHFEMGNVTISIRVLGLFKTKFPKYWIKDLKKANI